MNKTRIFLSLATVCAAVVLSFTWSGLHIGPGETSVQWSFPMTMAAGDTGEMVIENDAFKSLVVLDREGRVTGVVRAGVEANGFQDVLGLAVSSNRVYVADAQGIELGACSNGVRIASFAFDGTYAETVYREGFPEVRANDLSVRGIAHSDGRLYVFKADDGVGTLSEVVDGRRNVVYSTSRWNQMAHTLRLLPKRGCMVVACDTGETYRVTPDGKRERCVEMENLQSVACGDDGTLYWSDRKRDVIFRQQPGGPAEPLAKAWADQLAFARGKLYFSDHRTRSLRVCDVATGTVSKLESSPYAPALLWRSRTAWSSAALLALLLLVQLVLRLVKVLRRRRSASEAPDRPDPDAPIGMSMLYGRNLALTLLIFAVVTATLSASHYGDLLRNGRNAAATAANLLRDLTAGPVADEIADWDGTPHDKATRRIGQLVRDICRSCSTAGTELDCIVLRHKGSDNRCMLTMNRRAIAPGDLADCVYGRHLHRDQIEANAREGRITEYEAEGFSFLAVPIRDSQNRLQAVAYLRVNAHRTFKLLVKHIGELSVDLLSQLLVLVMIFGEWQLMAMFLRKRRDARTAGMPPRTMCEVQRPIRILQYVVSTAYLAFLPELSAKSAAAAGLSGELMTTLPIVALAVGYYFGRMVLQDLCSRSPRNSLWAGCLGLLGFAALMFGFAGSRNYWLLVGAMTVQAVAAAVLDCVCMSLRGCGLEPDRKFRLLVFTNMEPAIGCGIGAALGAFLYAKLGLEWVTGAIVVLAAVTAALGTAFVGRDIDASQTPQKRGREGQGERGEVNKGMGKIPLLALTSNLDLTPSERHAQANAATLKFCLKPFILAIVLCVTMPLGIVSSFESYALPVFNEASGHSVVLVGFVLVLAKFMTLFVLPPVIRKFDAHDNVFGMTFPMVCLLGTVLLFAFSPTLVSMVLVVLVFGVVDTVVTTCAERQEVESAARCGVAYDSAAKFLVVGEAISYSAGAPIFCWLMARGYGFLGFAVFVSGAVLLGVFRLVVRAPDRPRGEEKVKGERSR